MLNTHLQMGIEHVLLPEQGLVLPGDVVIGADSHTCTYGALGAFATGMGSTDIAAAMATGDIWMKVPPTIKLVYHGSLREWVGGKDLILFTIGNIGVDGALYSAIEFTGEAIDALSIDGRFTMANMAIEAGARAGMIAVDQTTIDYVKGRPYSPTGETWDKAVKAWKDLVTDDDAEFDEIIRLHAGSIEPQVTWGTSPEMV